MTRTLFLTLCLVWLTTHAWSQNAVGTWKRTTMTLTEANGKTTDMMSQLTKAMPCTVDITYTFKADGTFQTVVPESCGPMKKTIEQMNKSGRWSATGDKLKVVMLDKSLPDANYELTVKGNTMTWSFKYADNPQMPNPTKAKGMAITYQRL